MHEVSLFRLYLLRALYLLVVVGLGAVIWPGVIAQDRPWEMMEGVVACMLAAFSLLCALGLRYPLQMLPVLFWELLWKGMWLSIVAYPQWMSGTMDKATMGNAVACLVAVIIPFVIPWKYVYVHYVRKAGDRWRN